MSCSPFDMGKGTFYGLNISKGRDLLGHSAAIGARFLIELGDFCVQCAAMTIWAESFIIDFSLPSFFFCIDSLILLRRPRIFTSFSLIF